MTKQYPTDRLFSLPRLITLEGINVLARRAPATRRLQVSRGPRRRPSVGD